ncbi:MAG: RNA pseudouridine synthase [Betaproteobacteria bacterium]|nr:RNA pseudouridine synthase [Betaproteobacteria bacterium]
MEKYIEREFIAGTERRGQRLDAALVAFFPLLGLRGRRRLWNGHLLLVNGIARSPAFRLRGGETIRLVPIHSADAAKDPFAAFPDDPPRLLECRGKLFFLYKPKGLHTESLAGGPNCGLADLLGRIIPDANSLRIRLLTRLDQGTSGIVLAAGDEDAARHWRQQENAGAVDKSYLALLEGRLDAEQSVRNALDLSGARHTGVLDVDGSALRHTRIRPLAYFYAAEATALGAGYPDATRLTLALCGIIKGGRHQIRAHAAHTGYPLAGDTRYGAQKGASFFLHHCRIRWPGGQVSCLPPWHDQLPDSVREQVILLFSCARNESVSA